MEIAPCAPVPNTLDALPEELIGRVARLLVDDLCGGTTALVQVRKSPSWPRSWANFSLL
jgi:hypothetical protein